MRMKGDATMVRAHKVNGEGPLYALCFAGSVDDCPLASGGDDSDGRLHVEFDNVVALVQYDVVEMTGAWGELYSRFAAALRDGHAIGVDEFAHAVELGRAAEFERTRVAVDDLPPFDAGNVEDILRGLAERVRGDCVLRLADCVLATDAIRDMPGEVVREDVVDAVCSAGGVTREDGRAVLDVAAGDSGDSRMDLMMGALVLSHSAPMLALRAARALAERHGLDLDAGARSTVTAEDEAVFRDGIRERASYVAGRLASFADADAEALLKADNVIGCWGNIVAASDDGDDDALRAAVRNYADAVHATCGTGGGAGLVTVHADGGAWREYARLMREDRYGEAARAAWSHWDECHEYYEAWHDYHPYAGLLASQLPSDPDLEDAYKHMASQPGFPSVEDQALAGASIQAMDRISTMRSNGPLMRIAAGIEQPMDDYREATTGEHYRLLCAAIGEPYNPSQPSPNHSYLVFGRYALTRSADGSITADPDRRRCCERWLNARTTDLRVVKQVLKGEDWMYDEDMGVTMDDERILSGTSGWDWDVARALTKLI
ncbi:hypothetical protein [Bifidobacterium olomucense]|uniref:Uncharacterized protein n=1 Tax=Bifidobacterium olomucense TaxID=2675324 RepID=A0A7Y0EWE6_9BIFI|nr:hypothetical protein [Bifidobacterium sp. DSM 109959]NMM97569.1 hypothetical protein [Bifidobacterium sp. DSM 109959]